uniref:Secreted protein n=1 Tax=Ornithodoros brasiliensis TaxID=888526 RepID=A0A1D2AIF5_ORNBR
MDNCTPRAPIELGMWLLWMGWHVARGLRFATMANAVPTIVIGERRRLQSHNNGEDIVARLSVARIVGCTSHGPVRHLTKVAVKYLFVRGAHRERHTQ